MTPNQPPVHRSRLAKQENKKIVQQTILLILASIALVAAFFFIGFPSLMKLAIALGNSKASSKLTIQEDQLPPLPPQFNPSPEATASATINLNGYAESGSIVALYHNGNKITESATDNDGNFSFSDVTLEDGENNFFATATDTAGNTSQQSQTQIVLYNTKPPELTIDTPKDGARLFGELQQLTDISGSTDPGVAVIVNDRQLVVTGDGSFSAKYELKEGDNTLIFVATDPAGNQTTKEVKVNFSK